jgi:hypothetical protein
MWALAESGVRFREIVRADGTIVCWQQPELPAWEVPKRNPQERATGTKVGAGDGGANCRAARGFTITVRGDGCDFLSIDWGGRRVIRPLRRDRLPIRTGGCRKSREWRRSAGRNSGDTGNVSALARPRMATSPHRVGKRATRGAVVRSSGAARAVVELPAAIVTFDDRPEPRAFGQLDGGEDCAYARRVQPPERKTWKKTMLTD